MMFDTESHVADNPGGDLRKLYDPFPFYDFGMPRNFIRA